MKRSILTLLIIVITLVTAAGQPSKLVIIDPLVKNDLRDITDDNNQKIIILPEEGDPVKLIGEELKKSAYDEVHLYMLTKPGSIIFDEKNILPENIEESSADFRGWKTGLKSGSEIIIHSPDLGSTPEGLFITDKIAEYTGCPVKINK